MYSGLRGRLLASMAAITVCIAAVSGQGMTAEAKKKKAAAKAPSVCVGMTESACAGNAICYWRKAATTKSGKKRKAHCRKKPNRVAKQITPT